VIIKSTKNPIIKKKFQIFAIFSIFFQVFFKRWSQKITFARIWPLNFKISTWRKPTFSSVFHWLSFGLTFKKIGAHFFSKFFEFFWKIIFSSLHRNLRNTSLQLFKPKFLVISLLKTTYPIALWDSLNWAKIIKRIGLAQIIVSKVFDKNW
jgi:hypothetical protein